LEFLLCQLLRGTESQNDKTIWRPFFQHDLL
jgi:hypothetical protein